jgi:hypothetical protein
MRGPRNPTFRRAPVLLVVLALLMAPMARAQEQPLSEPVTALELRSEPLTVTLSPRPEMKPALQAARAGGGVVTVAIEGVEGTLTQPVRINVFINKPDADRTTPVDDPHFVGYIHVAPTREGVARGVNRVLDLAPVRDLDPDAPVRVTLVPVVGINDAPRDAALRVRRILIRREN